MRSAKQNAFTLVELLVVIGIIAVLISILLPALGRVRAQAAATYCASNQRQLAQAVLSYANDNRGIFPPSTLHVPNPNNPAAFIQVTWHIPELLGQYVRNTSKNPYYTNSRVLFCPVILDRASSAPNGFFGTDFGIGYNASTTIRDNFLVYRYPSVPPTDGGYAAQEQTLQSVNAKAKRLGRLKDSTMTLMFTDVGGGKPAEGGSRFVQLYNGAAATVTVPNTGANAGIYGAAGTVGPAGDAVSYRHGKRTNVAFFDGHVEAFTAKQPDDQNMDTHKNDGVHAAFLSGRLFVTAR